MLIGPWSRLCGRVCRGAGWRSAAQRRRYRGEPPPPAAGGLGELYERESVRRHLRRLVREHEAARARLQRASLGEADRRLLARRHAELQPVADVFGRLQGVQRDLEEVRSHLEEVRALRGSSRAGDEERQLLELLQEEEAHVCGRIEALREEVVKALVPSDPLDGSDIVLEVVSGRTTGGDICQQFTREMFHMYQGFAAHHRWDFELLNYTSAEYGGLHHAAARIAGQNVYKRLKHEGGTHRVQRIPEVGLSSRMQRIHTGTMTVIVLPQPEELDVHIDPKELRVDTFRSRGAGGQSVNTTDSAVRVVHLPTGIAAECQQTRSQLQNRDTAMRVLRARLYQSMMGKEAEQRLTARKQQVGTRAQSERIRTYNFSQDRVTDHRTGYSTRDIKEFMRGGEPLDLLISDVEAHAEVEALLEAAESSSSSSPGPEQVGPSA